jgi:hypothetical protein
VGWFTPTADLHHWFTPTADLHHWFTPTADLHRQFCRRRWAGLHQQLICIIGLHQQLICIIHSADGGGLVYTNS